VSFLVLLLLLVVIVLISARAGRGAMALGPADAVRAVEGASVELLVWAVLALVTASLVGVPRGAKHPALKLGRREVTVLVLHLAPARIATTARDIG